jgi:predicted DNA-binding transcriptional regulator AlpA
MNRALSKPLAAQYVGLSVSTFCKHVRRGEAPRPVRFPGKRVVWLRDDLDKWLDRLAGKVNLSGQTTNPWDEADGIG